MCRPEPRAPGRQMCSGRQQQTSSLIVPNALSALAFEHSIGISGVGIDDHSEEVEPATAETTGLVGQVADCGNPLRPKQVHDADPVQLEHRLSGIRPQLVRRVMNL